MSKIIGIDLGTTNSAVSIIEGGEPEIIENSEGNRTTPSVVAISKNGERLVGQVAKRQAVTNHKNTVYGIKRFIGHDFNNDAVTKDIKNVPFDVSAGEKGGVLVKMADKNYRPEEISAMVLQKLKKDAESKLGGEVTGAVITVPAYFNDSQRQATKDAGRIAGLDVKRIINEPTAAALAYGFNKKKDEQIVVFDFGGGTFDISVLEVGNQTSDEGENEQSIEVRSTDGDSHMGGQDIDQKIIEWIIDEFKKDSGIDISKDALAIQRLDESAEKAKLELSTSTETEINIPFITSDENGPKHLSLKLTRAKLEELASEFITRSIEITKRAIDASPFKIADIDEIILVGGQTRMPKIQEEVQKLFGKEPNKSINPDEVVAMGAAIQAGILQGDVKDVLLLDVIPLSLGIETMGGISTKLIEKNTTIPASKSQTFSTAADNQSQVEINIVQGERALCSDNKSLGRFVLDGIPPAPRGVPQIEVSFDIDANGILKVKALDKTSNKEQSIKIEATSGLSEDDIKKMQEDADKYADEDAKKRELVDAKNLSEQTVYTAEKALKDAGDKVPEEIKKSINDKISNLKESATKDDLDVMKNNTTELNTEMQKIAQYMNESQQKSEGDIVGDDSKEETSKEDNSNIREAEIDEDNTDGETPENEKTEDEGSE